MSSKIGHTGTKEDSYVNILLVGPPKSGKTTFASTAPAPLWWDFDHGLKSVWDKGQPFIQFNPRADKKERPTHLEVRDKIKELKKESGEFYEFVRDNKIQTHIFDSISAFCDLLEVDVLIDPWDNTPTKPSERNGALQIQDYNWIMNRVNQTINDMISLPYNFIVTSWIERRRDDANRVKEQPMLSGEKLGSRIAGFFDEVFLMSYDDKRKVFLMSRDQTRTFDHAGSRSHVPTGKFENPTWEAFKQWWK